MTIGVRFAWLYAVLFLLPFPFDLIAPSPAAAWWQRISEAIGASTGSLFGVTAARNAYVGDALVRHLYLAIAAVAALVAAVVWARLDRSAGRTQRLDAWLRSYVRFALAYSLIFYGAIKVIPSQFPAPGLDTLYQPIGDASPMGLLWAVMGASYPYVLFTGMMEITAGMLLMFRRTAIAGTLIAVALLTQVLVLNIGYDVPEKLLIAHLLAMAAYLVAPEVRRMATVLAGHAVGPASRPPLFVEARANRIASWGGVVVAAYFLAAALANAAGNERALGGSAPRSPLHGVWQVLEFSTEGVPVVELARRWRQLVFDGPEWAGLQFEDGSYVRVRAVFDATATSLRLLREGDRSEPAAIAELTVDRAATDLCVMAGTTDGHPVRVRLTRVEARPFLLNLRDRRWILESEFIR